MPENQGICPDRPSVTALTYTVQVAVNTPSHSGVDDLLDYTSTQPVSYTHLTLPTNREV